MLGRTLLLALIISLPIGAALADPCEGALPAAGTPFAGQVRYVGDGDGLCVGRSSDAATWIDVSMDLAAGPIARARLPYGWADA